MPRGSKTGSSDWHVRQRDTKLYCQARKFEIQGQVREKNNCLDEMSSDHARKCAASLLKRREVADALDPVLAMDGIRYGFWLKMMHRVLACRCTEQVVTYLGHIKTCWDWICGDEMPQLQDVESLENRCPKYSQKDAIEIKDLHSSGKIFSDLSKEKKRILQDRLSHIDTLIPSLTTFFEDFKILEKCSLCFSHIIYKKQKLSIASSLDEIFQGFKPSFSGACFELWLFTLQNFREMQPNPSKKDTQLRAREAVSLVDETVVHSFASLAFSLGFESPKITRLKNRDPEKASAVNCLLGLRNPEEYVIDKSDVAMVEDMMSKACQSAKRVISEDPGPCLVGPAALKPRYLYGFPDIASYQVDRKYLGNFDHMFLEPPQGEVVTSFFRLRSFCIAFFNDLPLESDRFQIRRGNTGDSSPITKNSASSRYSDDVLSFYRSHNSRVMVDRSLDVDLTGGDAVNSSDAVHLDTVFFRNVTEDGRLEILASVPELEVTEPDITDLARTLYRLYRNLAWVDTSHGARLHFTTPSQCNQLVKTEGIRQFLLCSGPMDGSVILAGHFSQ